MAMDSEPQGLLAKAMVAMIGGVLQQAIEGDLDMVKAYCERTSA